MTWNDPEYGLFDHDSGLQELMDKVKNEKFLVVCYEENSPGKTAGLRFFRVISMEKLRGFLGCIKQHCNGQEKL